jgi:hypothetical protein
MATNKSKPQPPAPAAGPIRLHPDTLLGSAHPSTIPASPQYAPQDVAFRAPPTPPVPHTTRLLIVRAPGGFTLFDADGVHLDQPDADPAQAIAVASTHADLVARMRVWIDAKPASAKVAF